MEPTDSEATAARSRRPPSVSTRICESGELVSLLSNKWMRSRIICDGASGVAGAARAQSAYKKALSMEGNLSARLNAVLTGAMQRITQSIGQYTAFSMNRMGPLVLLAFLLLQSVSAQVPGAPGAATANGSSRKGHQYKEQAGDLPNFHEVHPYLYRGGQPTPAGLKKLKEMGISTIIDLRGSPEQVFDEEQEVRQLGIKTINLPMSSQPPTKRQVKTFLKEVESAASGESKGPVFVHCAHGSDRTGCLVGIWRVTHDGWSYDQAYKEMRKYYFTPKFTKLSRAVRDHVPAKSQQPSQQSAVPPEGESQEK